MSAMSKEQLIQALEEAFERVIATVTGAAQRGLTPKADQWGLRETVAHMAGWEVMATIRVPHVVAGMPPLEFPDDAQQTVMDDAINATIVTMIGDQSLDAVCSILRQAYRRDIEMLRQLDERFFHPGEYVYERTKGDIEHCHEHLEALGLE